LELTELEKFYKDDAYCGFSDQLNVDRYNEYAGFVKKHCHGKVYEIGSGLGLAAIALKKSGVDVVATDIFPNNSLSTFEKFKISIPVESLNVNHIEKADGSVENYCLYQVMEHIENPKKAVDEIYRTLKPGGLFILVGPNLISPLTSLKALLMSVARKWDTPWFVRKDKYTFPFGGTIIGIFITFFKNLFLSLNKCLFKSSRNIIYRTPCLEKPAISDSDAVNLLNPFDMRSLFEKTGFEIVSYQEQRKFGGFSGSTWIVGKKK
jgi:SAM-dependent methyltransferase